MSKNTLFMLIGNYGVGKSTLIDEPIISKEGIFIEIRHKTFVLGNNICGADSLSALRKESVLNVLKTTKGKNVVMTGNYYCQIRDVTELVPYYKIIIVYLQTSFENNAERIRQRGALINIKTYNMKLKSHISMIKQTKKYAKVYILDNNRTISEVKTDFYKIVADETN